MTVTFMTFSFTFTIVVQFENVKVCTFLYIKKYIYIFGKNGFKKKLNRTDTYLS